MRKPEAPTWLLSFSNLRLLTSTLTFLIVTTREACESFGVRGKAEPGGTNLHDEPPEVCDDDHNQQLGHGNIDEYSSFQRFAYIPQD